MTKLEKIAEGREAEIFAWQDGNVLKLMRSPRARQAVEWQANAMNAARAAGIDVPEVRGTKTVRGRPRLIMERIDGPDMLTLIGKEPWLIFPGARIFGRLHAQMHETEAPADLPNLRERMRRRIEGSKNVPKNLAQFACSHLETLPDAGWLCHGDFHPANIIWNEDRQSIIDWTGVARGDPAADYARTMFMLRLGEPPPGSSPQVRILALVGRKLFMSRYQRAYRDCRTIDQALVHRWEVPVMAIRLVEGIEEEQPKILKLLEERLAASQRS